MDPERVRGRRSGFAARKQVGLAVIDRLRSRVPGTNVPKSIGWVDACRTRHVPGGKESPRFLRGSAPKTHAPSAIS